MRYFAYIFLSLFALKSYAQKPSQQLMAIEYNDDGQGRIYYLTSYRFIDGKHTSKDTIISSLDVRGQANFLNIYSNNSFFLKDNYFITSSAIIDIKSKQIIWKNGNNRYSNKLYKIKGNNVIFKRAISNQNTQWKEEIEFHCFNLLTREQKTIEASTVTPSNQFEDETAKYKISPDGKNALYTGLGKSLHSDLIIYDLTKKKSLANLNYKNGITIQRDIPYSRLGNIEFSRLGTIWLDNKHILYDSYQYSGDDLWYSTANASIYKINILNNTTEKIGAIDSVILGGISWFEIDFKHQYFYKTPNNKIYYVDLENKKLASSFDYFLSDNISFSNTLDSKNTFIYKYKNQQIGQFKTRDHHATSHKLACVSDDKKYQFGEPVDVHIWTAQTKAWSTITISDFQTIIGWMEE